MNEPTELPLGKGGMLLLSCVTDEEIEAQSEGEEHAQGLGWRPCDR